MRNLKYIKLYEAFDSNILSKVMGYIKDKKGFINVLRNVCNYINYPESKLSDEYFEYLPFNKALSKIDTVKDEPCSADSVDTFGSSGIEGEKCNNGRIKRKWGKTIRNVECTVCGGTGLSPKEVNIKLLKFWFNKDGEYITTTAVDGKMITDKGEMDDYELGDIVNSSDQLEHGNMVSFRVRGRKPVHGFIYVTSGQKYVIHNSEQYLGNYPNNSEWRKYGKYSWNITHNDFDSIQKLIPIEGIDYYNYNKKYYSGKIVNSSIKDDVKDAHFALILDFDKLKKSDFTKRSEIKFGRKDRIKGSLIDKEMSNELIKKRNIQRYFDELSKRMNIVEDISNANKLIRRSLFNKNIALIVIRSTDIITSLNKIMWSYYYLMDDKRDKSEVIKLIDISSNQLYNIAKELNDDYIENIDRIKNTLIKNDPLFEESLNILNDISTIIYNKLTSINLESIEDIDALYFKISTIRDIIRLGRFDYVDNFINYYCGAVRNDNYIRYLSGFDTRINEVNKNLKRVKSIIEKV
jgi:hypothetical protein